MAFRFKQFTVRDERSTLKVGTDAVLLGSWAGDQDAKYILDVGTGCGLLSLMLAQRFPGSTITAIDIHHGSVLDAVENFKASPWDNRLLSQHISLQDYLKGVHPVFDLIISNPPFFNRSLLPPDEGKKIAKHTEELSYTEIVISAKQMLKPTGTLALILPYENREVFNDIAKNHELYCKREMIIYPVAGKKPNRYMSEWGFARQECKYEELYIRDRNHNYTEEYKMLTGEFYLAH